MDPKSWIGIEWPTATYTDDVNNDIWNEKFAMSIKENIYGVKGTRVVL